MFRCLALALSIENAFKYAMLPCHIQRRMRIVGGGGGRAKLVMYVFSVHSRSDKN